MFRTALSFAALAVLAVASSAAGQSTTTTVIAANPTSGTFGTTVTLSGSITGSTTGSVRFPAGSLTFKDGTTSMGAAPITSDAFTKPTFNSVTLTNPPSYPVDLILTGDVNGDGKPDLILNVVTGLQAFINNGNSTYTGAAVLPFSVSFSQGAAPWVLTDYNGDGKMDLLTYGDRGLHVLLGNGAGVFQLPVLATAIPLSGAPFGLATADLTGSGHLDVIVGYTGACTNGSPGCAAGPYVATFLNHGNGTFGSANTLALPMQSSDFFDYPQVFQFVDLNGDSKPDVLASIYRQAPVGETYKNEMDSLISNGDGTFHLGMEDVFSVFSGPAVSSVSPSVAIGDFNGDGKVDLAQSESPSTGPYTYQLVKGNGDGTFAAPVQIGSGPAVTPSTHEPVTSVSLFAVDLNADGNLDLVNGYGYALQGNGDLTFGSPVLATPLEIYTTLGAADFTADGIGDVLFDVIQNPSPGSIGILQGNANGSATLAPVSTLAAGTHSITGVYPGDGALTGSTSAPVTVTITQQSSTLTATSSTAGVLVTQPVPLSVKVTAAGTPTGMVTFTVGSTTLETATVDGSGNATINYTFNTVGAQTVTATYSGDANTTGSSTIVAANTLAALAIQSTGSTTLSTTSGGTATAGIAVASQNGFAGSVTLSCSGLTAGATCSFNPGTLTVAAGATANSTMTVSAPTTTSRNTLHFQRTGEVLAAGLLCGMGALFKRRRMAAGALLLMAVAFISCLTGCSGGSNSSSTPSTAAKSYNFNVVATSGTSQTVTAYTLNVQ